MACKEALKSNTCNIIHFNYYFFFFFAATTRDGKCKEIFTDHVILNEGTVYPGKYQMLLTVDGTIIHIKSCGLVLIWREISMFVILSFNMDMFKTE